MPRATSTWSKCASRETICRTVDSASSDRTLAMPILGRKNNCRECGVKPKSNKQGRQVSDYRETDARTQKPSIWKRVPASVLP